MFVYITCANECLFRVVIRKTKTDSTQVLNKQKVHFQSCVVRWTCHFPTRPKRPKPVLLGPNRSKHQISNNDTVIFIQSCCCSHIRSQKTPVKFYYNVTNRTSIYVEYVNVCHHGNTSKTLSILPASSFDWPLASSDGSHKLFHGLLAQPYRQANCLPLGLCKGTVSPLKIGGNSHRSGEPTIHCDWGIPNKYLDQPFTKGDASQLEAMSHTPLRVPLPPGKGCEAVRGGRVISVAWRQLLITWYIINSSCPGLTWCYTCRRKPKSISLTENLWIWTKMPIIYWAFIDGSHLWFR